MKRRLYVIAPGTQIRDEIHLELFAHYLAVDAPSLHDGADVDGKAPRAQLVVHDVLHDVGLLDLPESKPRVAQTDVLEVVFLRTPDVLASLDVVPAGLFDEEGLLKVADVSGNGVRGDLRVQNAFEGRLDFGWVGERADGGCQHVHEVFELLGLCHLVPGHHILQVCLGEQAL